MSLAQVYKQFPTLKSCLKHLEGVRWHGKPTCPYCKSMKVTVVSDENRYHCNTCNTSFSVTVGTIFHKTKVDLQKWFVTIFIVLNAKEDISVRRLAEDIEVNKNTAWMMLTRIRGAMSEQGEMLQGIVETIDI